jgi:hypothetical protein
MAEEIGNSSVETDQRRPFTEGEIRHALTTMQTGGIFGVLREQVQASGSFFDPRRRVVDEDGKTPTGDILTAYWKALSDESSMASQAFYTQKDREAMMEALDPNGRERTILLAFFNANDASPWRETVDDIGARQEYKTNKGFPATATVIDVLGRTQKVIEDIRSPDK